MKANIKKLFALIMAFAMVLSLAAPAFAYTSVATPEGVSFSKIEWGTGDHADEYTVTWSDESKTTGKVTDIADITREAADCKYPARVTYHVEVAGQDRTNTVNSGEVDPTAHKDIPTSLTDSKVKWAIDTAPTCITPGESHAYYHCGRCDEDVLLDNNCNPVTNVEAAAHRGLDATEEHTWVYTFTNLVNVQKNAQGQPLNSKGEVVDPLNDENYPDGSKSKAALVDANKEGSYEWEAYCSNEAHKNSNELGSEDNKISGEVTTYVNQEAGSEISWTEEDNIDAIFFDENGNVIEVLLKNADKDGKYTVTEYANYGPTTRKTVTVKAKRVTAPAVAEADLGKVNVEAGGTKTKWSVATQSDVWVPAMADEAKYGEKRVLPWAATVTVTSKKCTETVEYTENQVLLNAQYVDKKGNTVENTDGFVVSSTKKTAGKGAHVAPSPYDDNIWTADWATLTANCNKEGTVEIYKSCVNCGDEIAGTRKTISVGKYDHEEYNDFEYVGLDEPVYFWNFDYFKDGNNQLDEEDIANVEDDNDEALLDADKKQIPMWTTTKTNIVEPTATQPGGYDVVWTDFFGVAHKTNHVVVAPNGKYDYSYQLSTELDIVPTAAVFSGINVSGLKTSEKARSVSLTDAPLEQVYNLFTSYMGGVQAVPYTATLTDLDFQYGVVSRVINNSDATAEQKAQDANEFEVDDSKATYTVTVEKTGKAFACKNGTIKIGVTVTGARDADLDIDLAPMTRTYTIQYNDVVPQKDWVLHTTGALMPNAPIMIRTLGYYAPTLADHDWDDGVTSGTSADEKLVVTKTCKVCGTTSTESISNPDYQPPVAEGYDMTKATVEFAAKTYNGKAFNNSNVDVKVMMGTTELKQGLDYKVETFSKTNAGTYNITVEGQGKYSGRASGDFVINKAKQKLKLSVTAPSAKKLKKGAKKVTYKVSGCKTSYTVKATGPVTVSGNTVKAKKGTKKGKKIKITVTAAEDANYKAASKSKSVKVKK